MMTKGATVSEPELEKKYTEQNVWPQCLDELSDDTTQMKYILNKNRVDRNSNSSACAQVTQLH